jgi:CBS domain containing-hemolysin-like protein
MRQRPDGSWIVSGLLRPDEVLDATGLALPEHEDYDTVAGLLVQHLGRIPVAGDAVDVPLPVVIPDDDDAEPVVEHAHLRVVRMDGLRVDRIAIQRQPGPPSAPSGATDGTAPESTQRQNGDTR